MVAGKGNLLWIYSESFVDCKDKATWMETSSWLARMGWNITMLSGGVNPEDVPPNISSRVIPRNKFYFFGYVVCHLRIMMWVLRNRSRFDVILFHPEALLFLIPLKLWRTLSGAQHPKLMMDVRTLTMFQAGIKGWLRTRYLNFLLKMGPKIADGLTVITQEMADHLGLPGSRKMGVWSSGVDSRKFHQAFDKRRWPGPDDTIIFIYIGTVALHRNLTNACRAFLKVSQNGYPVKLVVLGGGDAWQPLADEFKQHKDVVDLKNTVPAEQVIEYLALSHVGLIPHPYSTKFRVSSPLKLFEYMAAGMPTLATDVVCHTSVVGDEDIMFWASGTSVDAIEQAIKQACAQRDRLPEMGARALEFSKRYDWETVASRLDKALEKLLAA